MRFVNELRRWSNFHDSFFMFAVQRTPVCTIILYQQFLMEKVLFHKLVRHDRGVIYVGVVNRCRSRWLMTHSAVTTLASTHNGSVFHNPLWLFILHVMASRDIATPPHTGVQSGLTLFIETFHLLLTL